MLYQTETETVKSDLIPIWLVVGGIQMILVRIYVIGFKSETMMLLVLKSGQFPVI